MIQFRLKTLIAAKERTEGGKITYRDIREATGISLNTLTAMSNNKMKQIHLSTIERLCYYFDCPLDSLMVLDDEVNPQQKFRRQLYEKISQQIDRERILPKLWSLPGHLKDVIRVELKNFPRDELWSFFQILKDGQLLVGLSIQTKDKQKNQDIFNQLQQRTGEIETTFGHSLVWEDPAHIQYDLPLQYPGAPGRWPAMQEEMIAS